MRTYRTIYILFADEEPAEAFPDERIAKRVLERCEEWEQKAREIERLHAEGFDTQAVKRDKMEAHTNKHPIGAPHVNAQDYALKTVFLYE